MIDGVASEYLAAARKYLGEEQGTTFEAEAQASYKQMAHIDIEPHWVKILDFQTRVVFRYLRPGTLHWMGLVLPSLPAAWGSCWQPAQAVDRRASPQR
jgi:hypothetical protein